MKFSNYFKFSRYLDELGLFHMDLSLGRMEEFVRNWGGKNSFPVIHVVGTNGKGSTSSYISSIAQQSGLKVGTYTSPHFITPRERVTINSAMLSEDEWCEAANQVMEIVPDAGLTYFELLTCMALVIFKNKGVDLAVMEAGLGGRFDATNTVDPDLTVFAPIGLDHEKLLGSTIELIAADKADAMRQNGLAVTSAQVPEALKVLKSRAAELNCKLNFTDKLQCVADLKPALSGEHQKQNAHLACCAWRLFCEKGGLEFNEQSVRVGVEQAFIAGRLQTIKSDRTFILDGAHNTHAFMALEKELSSSATKPDAIIFGCMKDKNLQPVKETLFRLTDGPVIACGIPGNERAFLYKELAEALGNSSKAAANIDEALSLLGSDEKTVLVCGSLYLLAAFYTRYPEFLKK
ncbi:bifunctional folylpolyglutamate synthase/dihydrofolate synthase [Maridesulfovibrio zosterae]|uniref:bifunctional folylpolyglutamate synthase/dihydrofolate synthase n=1 Tax=Maridesulfovibrio zosterae TaxID=82171 RepID=UPI0003FC0977|nr:folylpolyglutamate synthase/dihydrofolate synthase family protein [Maridesulfovibrio zosterae]